MREILFRGKRIDNGEWVYGDVRHDYDGAPDCISDYCGSNPVVPETVGQYTGLTDKNGKKIFEGDICQTKGFKLIDEKPFEIVWDKYYSGWYWQDLYVSKETDVLSVSVASITKVIGNIYDNLELLKGGEG